MNDPLSDCVEHWARGHTRKKNSGQTKGKKQKRNHISGKRGRGGGGGGGGSRGGKWRQRRRQRQ